MRIPTFTPSLRRRLTLALIPIRAAASALSLWAGWTYYHRWIDVPPPPGPVAADLLWALLVGLLIGAYLIAVVLIAVFVWYPLPKANR